MITIVEPQRCRTRVLARDPIEGRCSVCGHTRAIRKRVWLEAWRRNFTPACKKCGSRIYPVKRTCQSCNAVLRSENLDRHCAPCQRKRHSRSNLWDIQE